MSTDETYNGWKNRETWAFNLHWSNDQGLYNETLEKAHEWLEEVGDNDYALGRRVIEHWRDFLDDYEDDFGEPLPRELRAFEKGVGSWWRIDETEVGASVRESLS